MELEIVNFVKQNKNWMELLQAEPYNLDVKFDGDFVLLAYNQIASNFNYKIVQECRGIIFHIPTLTPVCIPFTKFFNVQEGLAHEIDWSTAKVQEKLDGSIIKLWSFDGEWHVSTNGTINADNATLQTQIGETESYLDLFLSAENLPEDFTEQLDPRYTYIFELVSPFNRVVVSYTKTEVYFIGCRNNKTYNEVDPDLCELEIKRPQTFSMKTVDECLTICDVLGFDKEGFVVVDSNFNRVKIKSVAYVAAHHLKNNGIVTKNRVVDMFRVNGNDDFLAVYPEYTGVFVEVGSGIERFLKALRLEWHYVSGQTFETRKDLAMYVSKTICPACMFSLSDKKFHTVDEWFWSQQNDKILQYIGVK